ncbi:glycosyltransferase family protein [Chryseobacterium taiwanense]|uniref:Glycosyl transferase family 1 domain-containing protein n=1 Tax=Chryseobacterium taiwanense TaxID=363331 RepID=A0A0B4DG95_9FLAO|nr:hypothetical protein [Chryseobacterium taiwanense]KIC63435.1 hypothetical protein RM51_07095 [Chryseobacterium taiwanense]
MKNNYNIYITHLPQTIKEGGMARNNAFFNYFSQNQIYTVNVFNTIFFFRFLFTLKAILELSIRKNKAIFIHQGTLLYLFPIKILKVNFIFKFVLFILKRSSNRNQLTVEINDLPYEQAVDLELFVDSFYLKFEKTLFSFKDVHFIFASHEMEAYVKEKFNLIKTEVIINGGEKFKNSFLDIKYEWENSSVISFIYAGTLDKGRQIEDLILLFNNRENVQLILIGLNGEWINKEYCSENIIYLGNFEEKIAHQIVSKCDIGIIPYNANRFYYNLCYPTKASFYITAGISFLSTPLLELKNVFEKYNCIFFKDINEWDSFLENLEENTITEKNEIIKNINEKFTWNYLLSKK